MESRIPQLSSTELQEKLDAALDEQRRLVEEVEALNAELATKEARLRELRGGGFNKGLTGIVATLRRELERAKRFEEDINRPELVLAGDFRLSAEYVIEKITDKMIFVRPRGGERGRENCTKVRKADPRLFGVYPIDVEATEKAFEDFQILCESQPHG